jgi:hypothetical protein
VSIVNEVLEYGRWRRECVCGAEGWTEPAAERVRQDPYDPATSKHAGPCQLKDVTDPAIVRAALRVKPGLGVGYEWVECNSCQHAGQVPHFAESVG